MDHPHPLSVHSALRENLEKLSPDFIYQELVSAQEKSWTVLKEIKGQLREGMSEKQGRELCYKIFKFHGVTKHWHPPYIRFGRGTTLTFKNPVLEDSYLKANDPVYLDLGPVWPGSELEYEGDVGKSFSFGSNPEFDQLIAFTQNVFNHCVEYWKESNATGEQLYQLAEQKCQEAGYRLNHDVAGHRVSDFPHHRYTKENLSALKFNPQKTIWIFELHILKNEMGCFIEDSLGSQLKIN